MICTLMLKKKNDAISVMSNRAFVAAAVVPATTNHNASETMLPTDSDAIWGCVRAESIAIAELHKSVVSDVNACRTRTVPFIVCSNLCVLPEKTRHR